MKLLSSRNPLAGYMFILPALFFMLAFIGYPVVYNLILGFQDVNVMTVSLRERHFVGLDNYIELAGSSSLAKVVWHTLYYTIACIVFQFCIGFALALLLSGTGPLVRSIRGSIMIAWLIPVTITGLLFKFIFSTNGGVINSVLLSLNVVQRPIEWLLQPDSAMWSLIITNTWIGIPFNMILLVTGLSAIPPSLYESADIDGAGPARKFFCITLPLLRPAIGAVLILGFIYTFKVFDLVYVMTKGGPVDATEVLSTLSYRLSFTEFSFSKGAAVANILFIVLLILSLFYLQWLKKDEEP